MPPDRLGPCGRCFVHRRATSRQRLRFGDSDYEMLLCEEHADAFLRDMHSWARCGQPLGAIPRPITSDDLGPVKLSHVPIPVIRAAPAPVAPAEPAVPAKRAPRADLPINHDRWTFSRHALERQAERGVDTPSILWTAEHPDVIRPSEDSPSLEVRIRGSVKIVVNPKRYEIVTVCDRTQDSDKTQRKAAV